MSGADALDPVAALVRRHDPDRFFTALFAPPAKRAALLTLYAVNHELARAREVASAPPLALIRLHWWREVVEGAPRRHEVATPLAEAIATGELHPPDLLAMIDGREAEADGEFPALEDWLAYLDATAGGVAVAAGRLLGAGAAELPRLRRLGAAYGVAGQLRSVAALARQGRCQLPRAVLGRHGLDPETVAARPDAPALRPVLADLAAVGRRMLAEARGRAPRAWVAAALPAVHARRDLSRPFAPAGPRGLGDRLAVIAAAVTGRV